MVEIPKEYITWSADKGEINANGDYVASEEEGQVTVIASYKDFTDEAKLNIEAEKIEETPEWFDALIAALIGKEMDKFYGFLMELLMYILAGLLGLFLLIYIARKIMKGMGKKFVMPPIEPGTSLLIEAPLESRSAENAYKLINETLDGDKGALVLSLKPQETVSELNKHISRMDRVKIVGVDTDLTKVGIRLSELIQKEKPGVVYFEFFNKVALMEEADVLSDFIEFNMIKLSREKTTGIFRLELNEKVTSEFLSKLEVSSDTVIEHRITDNEYARVKQVKEGEAQKAWLPF